MTRNCAFGPVVFGALLSPEWVGFCRGEALLLIETLLLFVNTFLYPCLLPGLIAPPVSLARLTLLVPAQRVALLIKKMVFRRCCCWRLSLAGKGWLLLRGSALCFSRRRFSLFIPFGYNDSHLASLPHLCPQPILTFFGHRSRGGAITLAHRKRRLH